MCVGEIRDDVFTCVWLLLGKVDKDLDFNFCFKRNRVESIN